MLSADVQHDFDGGPRPTSNPSIDWTPEAIARKLDSKARRTSVARGRWSARCPAHDDASPSLDIEYGRDGIVFICRAGCSQAEVTAAFAREGITLGKCTGGSRIDTGGNILALQRRGFKIAAAHDYHDADGAVLYQNVKLELRDRAGSRLAKTFRQRRPGPGGGWIENLDSVTRVPYRQLEIVASTGDVHVTEGEKDADRLAGLGLIATSIADPKTTNLAAFAGRKVILHADNDGPGRAKAAKLAEALAGIAAGVTVVDYPDTPAKGDVSDWLDAGNGLDDLMARIAEANAALKDAHAVEGFSMSAGSVPPAESEPAPWPILADEALHGIVGDIVRAATEHSEADPAAVLATTLTHAGAVIGRDPWVRVADDYHHARLFNVLVGQTARGRKGTSEGPVRRVWDAAEPHVSPLAWKPGPMSTGEGLANAIRDGNGEDDEGVSDKRLLIVESEFGASLRAMRREGNTLSSALRTAWDGKTIEPITKHQPIRATRPHICIIAHITEPEMRTLLGNVEIFNGFANRFLWWCVRRSKVLPLARGLSDKVAEKLGSTYANRLNAARAMRQIDFTAEARRIYEGVYPDLTSDHGGLYGVVISRAEVQVIRLALTYAALDGKAEIAPEHLDAALAVVDFCDASAKRLFAGLGTDALEDRVVKALTSGPKSRSDLHRALGGHTDATALAATLATLEGRGRIDRIVTKTGGRNLEVLTLRAAFQAANEAKKAN